MRVVTALLLLLAVVSAQASAVQHRRLGQVTLTTLENGDSSSIPAVEAMTGKLDKSALAALVLAKTLPMAMTQALSRTPQTAATQQAAPQAAAAPTVIVVPGRQQTQGPATATTTTGAINVETDTPVKVSSPIEIDASERRVVASKGKKGFGWRSDPGKQGLVSDAALGAIALSGFGNSLANSANAAGSIVTAVGTFLDALLPNCPPRIPGLQPIPGCN